MTFAPSQKFVGVLRLRLFLATLPVAFALGAIYYFNHIPALVLSVGIFVLFCFLWLVYIPMLIKSQRAVLEASALWVYKGIIIKRRHIIPYNRYVYCKVCSGPVLRLLGLVTVKIRLVGGDIEVGGVCRQEAELLISKLEGKYDKSHL